jgi:hypothetical protein
VLLVLVKALVGGLGVIAFAAVARVLRPERLAGVFAAAPSVAVGSLAVVVLDKGEREGLLAARGMVVGAAALVGACIVGALVARPADGSAVPISIATGVSWLVLAALIAVVAW